MNEIVKAEKINEVYMKVTADGGVRSEISEYFSFRPPGYQFTPAYKNRMWDGVYRMYNPIKPLLYIGVLDHLRKFCQDRDYILEVDPEINVGEEIPNDYPETLAKEIGAKLEVRDYQKEYILNALRNGRGLSLSPTSSGKSFIIYLIQQHYYQVYGHKTLIIVPTTGLVDQMAKDFVDYGADASTIYKIRGGVDKNIPSNINVVVSTWQSLVRSDREWFDQFRVVLGDEAHNFQAKSLTTIMEKLSSCPYRFGFTGTISSDSKIHKLILEGVFGPIKRFVTTKQLIDQGTVADLKIKAIVLSHDSKTKQDFKQALSKIPTTKKYSAEREFLVNNSRRNMFIRNLVWSLENQNNLILFDLVEKHGKILEPLLRKEGRVLHFLHGGISADEREYVRETVENDPIKRHDILASSGVFSTGVNLKRLDNAIFAASGKSEIRVLQSIGRTLRKGNGADNATLYDITDDLCIGSYENYTLKHFRKRLDIYADQEFPFKIYTVNL